MTVVQRQISRTWQQYTIMHLDRRIASIRSNGTCTIYAASFMPCNLILEQPKDINARVNNLDHFYLLVRVPGADAGSDIRQGNPQQHRGQAGGNR